MPSIPDENIADVAPRRYPTLSRLVTGGCVGLMTGLLYKELGLRMLVSFWGPIAPLVFGSMIVGAIVWMTRLRRFLGAFAVLLTLTWLCAGFTPLCERLIVPLLRYDKPKAADAIFVLSSSVQIDDDPSPNALSRATRGLELLGGGYAPRLYLSELHDPAGSYKAYVGQMARRMGIPHATAIEDVGVVGNTHDEAKLVAELFKKNNWHTLLLVTSPTHSRRAAATFERAGVPEVISVPATETLFDAEWLSRSDDRLQAFAPIIHEWVGWTVYRLRGWR